VESSGARVVTILWAILVGAATIGSFVIGVIVLARGQ